jgi:outer membrane receptor for ferrienterochelin and colicins
VAPAFLTNGWAFGQLAWSFGPRHSLLLGARAEYHSQYGAIAVPRLSQAFHATEELTLRAGVGRGFRNPTPKELGFEFDHCSLGYSVTGNPELDPERSWGVNGDASLRATPGLLVRVGGFANWIRDMIATPLDPSNQGLCRTGVNYRTANVGRAITAGSDLGVRAEPSAWLRIKAAYSYLWTRDQDAGQPLDARPPHTFVLGLDIDLPQSFVANLSYRYKSAVFFENGETDLESTPFGTLRARIAFRPLASLQAYVGVENLTDVTRSPQDPADIRPQLGRTLYAGLSGDFSTGEAEAE